MDLSPSFYLSRASNQGLLCAVCSVQCVMCSVQCAVYSVKCAVCSVQRAVWSVQYAACSSSHATPEPTTLPSLLQEVLGQDVTALTQCSQVGRGVGEGWRGGVSD